MNVQTRGLKVPNPTMMSMRNTTTTMLKTTLTMERVMTWMTLVEVEAMKEVEVS